MRTVLDPITVTIDGTPTPSETTLAQAGAYVVVLATALPEIPLTVTSTFIGAQDVDTTIVDLTLGLRPHAHTETRTVARDHVPVTHAHDRCLLEHAATVRTAVAHTTQAHVSIDVPDTALQSAAQHHTR